MSIALPPDVQRFVEREVASGADKSPDDLIAAAVELLRQHQVRLAQLKADIDEGMPGDGIPAESVFSDLRAKFGDASEVSPL
jgi:putative addiction module CopG family antidote